MKPGAPSVLRHASLVGAVCAIALHVLLAGLFVSLPARRAPGSTNVPVEVDLASPRPDPLPPPPPDPPAPAPEPKLVARKPGPRLKLPPMPNQEVRPQPPTEEPPPPVFGVTQDSVVAGESTVAVPVGNTLMTNDRTLAKAPPVPLPSAPPPPAFDPVDEDSVEQFPEALVKPDLEYPEMARRMGVAGKVRLRIGIDHKGNVKSVRVLDKVGYGMDEAATKFAWRVKWKPARRADGQPVDIVITYNCRFDLPNR